MSAMLVSPAASAFLTTLSVEEAPPGTEEVLATATLYTVLLGSVVSLVTVTFLEPEATSTVWFNLAFASSDKSATTSVPEAVVLMY